MYHPDVFISWPLAVFIPFVHIDPEEIVPKAISVKNEKHHRKALLMSLVAMLSFSRYIVCQTPSFLGKVFFFFFFLSYLAL